MYHPEVPQRPASLLQACNTANRMTPFLFLPSLSMLVRMTCRVELKKYDCSRTSSYMCQVSVNMLRSQIRQRRRQTAW